MQLTPFQIAELMAKYLKNNLSEDEEALLQKHLEERSESHQLLESFRDTPSVQKEIDFISELDVNKAWNKISPKKSRPSVVPILKWVAAVAAVVLIAVTIFWPDKVKIDTGVIADATGKYKNDVLPGTNKAELVLSNGKVVILNDEANLLKEEDGTAISGNAGELKYAQSTNSKSTELLYNTLKVPKAGTYRLILPDGSKVWLNALSEIRFPVQFTTNERKVSLKGEAYFEIHKDVTRPFKVEAKGSTVEVLGTHFNVNSYDSQSVTTLLEGQVKIWYQQQQAVLKPGQEANILNDKIRVQVADIQKAIAWKEEIFYFQEDGMDHIMEQLSRWYDLKITLEGKPTEKYSGSIKRNAKLSEVLEMLRFISGATFEIEERNLHVKY